LVAALVLPVQMSDLLPVWMGRCMIPEPLFPENKKLLLFNSVITDKSMVILSINEL